MPQQTGNEVQVFLAARHQFGDGQVVNFKAKPSAPAGVLIVNGDQTLTPSFRQHGRLNRDTVGVVTESLMKRRAFTILPPV